MAIDLETMRAKLRLEADGFDTGIAGAKRALTGFRAGVDVTKAKLDELGEKMRSVGRKMTLGLTLPIVAGFGLAVNAASDLGEAQSATDTIFGASSVTVQKWAKTTANAYGISNEAALTGVNTLAQVYKGFGVTEDAAAKYGMAIVNASGDLASFKNLNTADVLADLQSGIVGQYEPLLKYGIVLNEASVNQRAMEMTGKANADQLTAGEKVLARQELILEGLGDAQGDAARTANGLANVQRRLRAIGQDLAAKWGKILLPVVLKFGLFMLNVSKVLNSVSPSITKMVVIVLSLVAALGPVLYFLGLLAPAFALLLGPVGLIIIAVGLLVAAFSSNFLGIRDKVTGVADSLQHLWTYMKLAYGSGISVSQLVNFLPDPLKRVGRGFLLIADAVGDVVHAFQKGGFSGLLDALPGELSQIWQGLEILGGALWDKFAGLPWADIAQSVLDTAVAAFGLIPWGGIWDGIKSLGASLSNKFVGLPWGAAGNTALNAGKLAFQSVPWGTIWDGISTFFSGLWDKFQNYDYNSLGVRVGEGIRGAIEAAGPTLLEIGGKIIRSLKDGLEGADWQEVLKWVALIPVAIPLAIVGAATVLGPKAAEFIAGFLEGLGVNWETVTNWLNSRDEAALLAIGTLTETLLQKGKDIIDGFRGGAADRWQVFTTWIKNRGASAVLFIGDLSETLLNKGKSLISGFRSGALDKWDTFTEWLGGRPDSILAWIGDLGGLLYGAGQDAIQGLINGAQSKIPGLQKVVDTALGIWNLIPGQGNSPWPAMIEAGQDAMNGVIIGANSRMRALTAAMDKTIDIMSINPVMSHLGNQPALAMTGTVTGINASFGSNNQSKEVHYHTHIAALTLPNVTNYEEFRDKMSAEQARAWALMVGQ